MTANNPTATILPGLIAYLFGQHHDPHSVDSLASMSYDELDRLRAQAEEAGNNVLIERTY